MASVVVGDVARDGDREPGRRAEKRLVHALREFGKGCHGGFGIGCDGLEGIHEAEHRAKQSEQGRYVGERGQDVEAGFQPRHLDQGLGCEGIPDVVAFLVGADGAGKDTRDRPGRVVA